MSSTSHSDAFWSRIEADFFLWTIRRQSHISAIIRTQLMTAVSVALLLTILLPIRLETALHVIFYSGLTVIGVLWGLIERRKSWLLGIRDPALKESAHRTMLIYLRQKYTVGRRQNKCGDNECTLSKG